MIAEFNYGKFIVPIRALTAEEKEQERRSPMNSLNPNNPIPETTGGHVPGYNNGYQVTRKTRGLAEIEIGLATRELLGFNPLPHELKNPYGALIIRQLPSGSIAAQCARFRPEAGEDEKGRSYLQANTLIIPENFWYRHASQLARQVAYLRATPDPVSASNSAREGTDPVVIDTEPHEILTPESSSDGTQFLLKALQSTSETVISVPPELFGFEDAFVAALGEAVEIFTQMNPNRPPDLKVAINLSDTRQLQGRWITFQNAHVRAMD